MAVPALYTLSRTLASASSSTPTPKNEPKSTDNAPNRQPPSVLGIKERPIPDRNSWVGRQKQKLQDLTDYDKAFASHVEERRYLYVKKRRPFLKVFLYLMQSFFCLITHHIISMTELLRQQSHISQMRMVMKW
jgi:hypothetical protein